MNQTILSVIDSKKEQEDKIKREKLELLLQDKKFVKMVLEDLKKKTDKWLGRYYGCIKETKKWNATCKKNQCQPGLGDPIAYCKKVVKDETAIRIREGLNYPEFFAEICIEHQFLIPDDRIGYIVNEKLLKEKDGASLKSHEGHLCDDCFANFDGTMGIEHEDITITTEKIATGINHSQYERMRSIIEIIKKLCNESDDGNAARSDIISEAEISGVESGKVEDALDRLKRYGQIYEPMHGKYRVTEY